MQEGVGAVQGKKSVFRSLAMVSQLGLCVVAPVFLCIFIGYQLDARFGWKVMIPMVILGVLGGARCAWQMAIRVSRRRPKGGRPSETGEPGEPSQGPGSPDQNSRAGSGRRICGGRRTDRRRKTNDHGMAE